ncbi:hypothetical protein [Methanosarcina barkeri]|nr:hypothetical protein [Methanosarcina barkeri]
MNTFDITQVYGGILLRVYSECSGNYFPILLFGSLKVTLSVNTV